MKSLSRGAWSWALYDCANSAFVLSVLTVFYGGFFINFWFQGPEDVAFFWQGVSVTATSVIVALLAPFLGSIADTGPVKKKWLGRMMTLGVLSTLGLAAIPAGGWEWAIALRLTASIGFFGSLIFYDALITDVSTEGNRHFVSGLGFSVGYGGSVLLLLAQFALLAHPEWLGLADKGAVVRISFVTVALWWVLFTLPLFWRVQERDPRPIRPLRKALPDAWSELRKNFRALRAERLILLFLVAYFFYIDGVNTLMQMVSGFASTIGVPENELIGAIIVVQIVGVPCAVLMGWLGQRFGVRPLLFTGIGVYFAVTAYASQFQGSKVSVFGFEVSEIHLLGAAIGMVQGGLQALSRSYFANLIPPGKEAAFFGFYNMLGKGGAILGPLLMGAIGLVAPDPRWGLLGISALFFTGGALLWRAKE
jgi:UMF1 family MFS transporter